MVKQGWWAWGLACALLAAVPAVRATTWSVVDIGASAGLPEADRPDIVRVQGLNDAGQVVGQYITVQGRRGAFLTGPDGTGWQDLGLEFATPYAVNGAGQVVGEVQRPDGNGGFPLNAFVTGPGGQGVTDLGQLPGSGFASARDINDAGLVVGRSGANGFVLDTTVAGGPSLTGQRGVQVLPGADPVAVDAAGRITGTLSTATGTVGFLSEADGSGLRRLEAPGWTRLPAALSDTGWIAGSAFATVRTDNNAFDEAFLMAADGAGPVFIGAGVARWSAAFGVNDAGQVVGVMIPDQAVVVERAFITGAGGEGLVDLNSLVTLANGAPLTRALGINDLGQVIAQDDRGHAYLLTPDAPLPPVPEPSAALLLAAGLGAVAGLSRRRRARP